MMWIVALVVASPIGMVPVREIESFNSGLSFVKEFDMLYQNYLPITAIMMTRNMIGLLWNVIYLTMHYPGLAMHAMELTNKVKCYVRGKTSEYKYSVSF